MLYASLITGSAILFISLLLLLRFRTALSISFSLFGISSALWLMLPPLGIIYQSTALLHIAFFAPVVGLTALAWFAYIFGTGNSEPLHIFLISIPAIVLIGMSPDDALIRHIIIHGGAITVTYGNLILLHRIFILTYLPLVLSLIALQRKSNPTQALWVVLSIAAFIVPASITNMLLPQVFGIARFNQYGPLFSIFMVGGIAYAITAHKLFDIRPAVQRAFAYTVFTGVISAIFGILLFATEHILGPYAKMPHAISGFITTMLGSIYGGRLIKFITRKTDPLFYQDRYSFRDAVIQIDTTMRRLTTRKAFIHNFFRTVYGIFKPERMELICFGRERVYTDNATLNLDDAYSPAVRSTLQALDEPLAVSSRRRIPAPLLALSLRLGIDVFVPIVHNGVHFGALCLGARRSGDAYMRKDLKLLRIAGNYAGVALQNIKLYERQRQHAKHLEREVATRTKELTELTEAQRQSMLDISHGLQNPLTLLRAELETQQLRLNGDGKYFNKFIQLVDRTSQLAYELVTLSRLNTTGNATEHIPVELSVIVRDVVRNVRSIAEGRDVTLKSDITQGVRVRGSAGDLQRLTMNLVKNAIKYTGVSPAEPRTVAVTLTANDVAVLSVSDTGIGIPEHAIPKLFNTFYRVDDTTEVEGTGIGLTIVKRIVETHDGSISVHSTLGSGSTFTVTLPLLKQD